MLNSHVVVLKGILTVSAKGIIRLISLKSAKKPLDDKSVKDILRLAYRSMNERLINQ